MTVHAAAATIDDTFRGLEIAGDDEWMIVGIYHALVSDPPWLQTKKAPALRGKKLVPVAVGDAGTLLSYWADDAGAIYGYSEEETAFMKIAPNLPSMIERFLFP